LQGGIKDMQDIAKETNKKNSLGEQDRRGKMDRKGESKSLKMLNISHTCGS
jgi:hypothetical protein